MNDASEPRWAGLSAAEAARRLAAEGPNLLPSRERHGFGALLLGVLREPMFLLLIGAAAIYLVLGDVREALVLAASIVVIIAITVVQERRTERALEALRDLSSPRALVIRDGREVRIAGAEVVRGDLMVLREGDRVAADARLAEAHALKVDESLLTGESVPVTKHAHPREGVEIQVFSGTLVVHGAGMGEVVATGPRTQFGRIGALLAGVATERTRLEVETGRMVRLLAALGLALCVVVVVLYIVLRGEPLAGVLAGLTLAMALLPEEFPVVLTVFLALGAMRIARHGVLTRRLPAVEMLGAATVLCCDKTGTLTENRMRVVELWDGAWTEPGRAAHAGAILEAAAGACEERPFDPMERAILDAAGMADATREAPEKRYPMTDAFLAMCHGFRRGDGKREALIKGAPETVVALCAMAPEARSRALEAAADAAERGLRVLGVAHAHAARKEWPGSPEDLPFRFLGLVGLADPVRAAVPEAIAACRRAGIRVVMITGDHPSTAQAIASQAGIAAHRVVTGRQLEAMGAAEAAEAVRGCEVFARVRPEQKLRLVEALRDAGEVVAMTGDGVNDAPALRRAHIGVAMGKRGTDVAREAAALVLLDDDFTAIEGTVRLGRRIYDNIRNAMRFLMAVHVPLAGMALFPLLAGWPLFAYPVHVVFLEFVIDPACSIVFEAEEGDRDLMERPPRPPEARLFNWRDVLLAAGLGLAILAVVLGAYGWTYSQGLGEERARTLAFTALVGGNLGLILANRSRLLTSAELLFRPNAAWWWIVVATLAALLAVIYVPAAAQVFRFAPPAPGELAAAGLAGFAAVLWYDLVKAWRRFGRSRRARLP